MNHNKELLRSLWILGALSERRPTALLKHAAAWFRVQGFRL